MPNKPKRLCKAHGCCVLTDQGYCEKHKRIPEEKEYTRKQRYEAVRPAWHSLYNTPRWQMLRSKILFAFPLCAECLKFGKYVTATVVHHRIAHKGDQALFYNYENLESLCKPCHDRHTSKEDSWNR